MSDPVRDLLDFIEASPTPFHAVKTATERLLAAGFRVQEAATPWDLSPGDRLIVIRDDSSLLAIEVGRESPVSGGFRIVGAHTDSPNLRLRPQPDRTAYGYRQLGVEPYGGLLLHTWLDRDLSVAGRVLWSEDHSTRASLIDFRRPLVRIPNLAIHLYREIREEGLKLNPQLHSVPIIGLEDGPDWLQLVATELQAQANVRIEPDDLLSFDLMLYDTQPPGVLGQRGEFIMAPRLDNLASCHAGLAALIGAQRSNLPRFTRMVVLYDHEEVGSRSARGADGPLLQDALERVVSGFKGGEPQGLPRALERSLLISADMAHAVHPNYAERHESQHRPVIGGGPVIKTNVNQAYATDSTTAGLFTQLCRRAGFQPQQFVSRNDQPCGSTIGPISAARVGIRTVDVGNPMLSMHSCREMAGSADVEPMISALRLFFEDDGLRVPG